MKTKLFLSAFALILVLFGCEKQPEASITASKIVVKPLEQIDFESGPGVFDAIEWDMGDGTMLTGRNVSYSYRQPGQYLVKLKLKKGNRQSIASQIIQVNQFTQFTINEINIMQYSQVRPNLTFFDDSPTNRIDLKVVFESGSFVLRTFNTIDNALQPVSLIPSPPIYISALNSSYYINLLDVDPGFPDEYVGGVSFEPIDYMTGATPYPTTINLSSNTVQLSLSVVYE